MPRGRIVRALAALFVEKEYGIIAQLNAMLMRIWSLRTPSQAQAAQFCVSDRCTLKKRIRIRCIHAFSWSLRSQRRARPGRFDHQDHSCSRAPTRARRNGEDDDDLAALAAADNGAVDRFLGRWSRTRWRRSRTRSGAVADARIVENAGASVDTAASRRRVALANVPRLPRASSKLFALASFVGPKTRTASPCCQTRRTRWRALKRRRLTTAHPDALILERAPLRVDSEGSSWTLEDVRHGVSSRNCQKARRRIRRRCSTPVAGDCIFCRHYTAGVASLLRLPTFARIDGGASGHAGKSQTSLVSHLRSAAPGHDAQSFPSQAASSTSRTSQRERQVIVTQRGVAFQRAQCPHASPTRQRASFLRNGISVSSAFSKMVLLHVASGGSGVISSANQPFTRLRKKINLFAIQLPIVSTGLNEKAAKRDDA